MTRKKHAKEVQESLESRLGPDVLRRLEAMAGEFVRFERGQFGFFIDPARYAVKSRQVGPVGRGRRRKIVAGVDKDGNVITAWIGVDEGTKEKTAAEGVFVNIPDGYNKAAGGSTAGTGKGTGADGAGGDGGASGTGGTGSGTGAGGPGGPGTGDGDGSGVGASGTGTGPGPGKPGARKSDGEMSASAVARAAAQKRAGLGTEKKEGTADEGNTLGVPPKPAAPKPPAGVVTAKDNTARGRKKKPLHWAKVPKNLVTNLMWASLEDGRVVLDEDEIDDLFGMDVAPVFEVTAEEVKPEVLAHKRKHNINILLANLKMSPDDIKDIIRRTLYRDADPNTLQALLLICPTPEEEELLINNFNLKDQVDKTDEFMMELAELRGLRGKMQCALAAKSFNEEAVEVIRNMDTFAEIPGEVINSMKLRTTLETVLTLGNFLNSGTGRGGAHGFKLEALAMLSTVKDGQGGTLLDYLVMLLEKKFPGTIPLDDMPTLPRSSDISLDAIGENVQSLLDSINNVGEQIKTIGNNAELADFLVEMQTFAEEAGKVRDEIVSLRALMMEKLQGMMGYFGERNKMARGKQEDILRMLREFTADTVAARERLLEKWEREKRKAEKEKPQVPSDVVKSQDVVELGTGDVGEGQGVEAVGEEPKQPLPALGNVLSEEGDIGSDAALPRE